MTVSWDMPSDAAKDADRAQGWATQINLFVYVWGGSLARLHNFLSAGAS